MSDTSNGAGPPPSLRDIAEQAYTDLETEAEAAGEGSEAEAAAEEPVASDDRPRDKSGRWVAKSPETQTGEAIARPPPPADPALKPDKVSETSAATPDPAAQARSNQAPEHWSAEDKATFAKIPAEGQAFLLRRHGEMEAEFTRKSQASAGAVQFTQSLAPVFNDRRIQSSLQQMGLNPTQAVQEWASLHIRAMSPDQKDKFGVLIDMTERMGLDPARIFSALGKPQLPPGLAEAELKDPAVKFFADRLGQIAGEHNALRSEIQQRWAAEQQARAQAGEQNARSNIDHFADERDAHGNPLRPYFDTVLPILLDLYKANPQRSMADAYDAACWSHPEVRKQLLAAEQLRVQSRQDVEKARNAQRGNTRGLTSNAVKPPGINGSSRGSLRDAIDQSAEEVGY